MQEGLVAYASSSIIVDSCGSSGVTAALSQESLQLLGLDLMS